MMNQQTLARPILIFSSLALSLAIFAGSPLQAAGPPESRASSVVAMQQRSERWQVMIAVMDRHDFEYAAELARVNDAPESEKLDTIVAVLTRLVEQSDTREPSEPVAPPKSAFPELPDMPDNVGTAKVAPPPPPPSQPPSDPSQLLPPDAPSSLSVTLTAPSSH